MEVRDDGRNGCRNSDDGFGPAIHGGREGYFHALDARTGALLWKASVGGPVAAAPITYRIDGKQYVAVAAGHALFVYGLRE